MTEFNAIKFTNDMLRIVRRHIPTTEKRFEIEPVRPEKSNAEWKPFDRMVIKGGMCHDFIFGWFFEPYKLVIRKGFVDGNITYIEEEVVVEECEDINSVPPELILDEWKRRMNHYNSKESERLNNEETFSI